MSGFFEYKQRVIYSLLRAASRVALRLRMPLGKLEDLLEMAYFQEARERQDLKLDAIAALFGKSLRTVSTLHQRFRGDFFAPEREVALRRAIAALIDHTPADLARLCAAFPEVEPPALQSALDDLVRDGILVPVGELWHRNPDAHEFLGKDPRARIDGLNRQMDILAETVWQGFIEGSDQGLARTYVFESNERDWRALLETIQQVVRERAVAADRAVEEARASGEAAPGQRVGFTFAAVPLSEEE